MNTLTGFLTRLMTPALVFTGEEFQPFIPFADENAQKQADDLGAQFTDRFIQDPEHVTLLLTLLEVLNFFFSGGMRYMLLYFCTTARRIHTLL